MTELEKAKERCNQLIKVEHANWIGISNQLAIKTLLKELEQKDTEINKLNNVIQNIREEFLKYDWENSTKEQICNQLKSLYESIFMKRISSMEKYKYAGKKLIEENHIPKID